MADRACFHNINFTADPCLTLCPLIDRDVSHANSLRELPTTRPIRHASSTGDRRARVTRREQDRNDATDGTAQVAELVKEMAATHEEQLRRANREGEPFAI